MIRKDAQRRRRIFVIAAKPQISEDAPMTVDPNKAQEANGLLKVAGTAEIVLPCNRLSETLTFFTQRLGFRVETIFPAEEPEVASLSGHGLRLRLQPGEGDPGLIRLPVREISSGQERRLQAPNGTQIELVDPDPPAVIPNFAPEFLVVARTDGSSGPGRAGMVYRDLIPGRLGGRYIASHISIPEGGPVADWVHFHKISFQLIFCRRGWARLAYEDQGPAFLFKAGDCVLQPPQIRHRVLESSQGFEVIEVGCPALHETLADHELTLPTGRTTPDRRFEGQLFRHHCAKTAPWIPLRDGGFERQITGLYEASGGLVDVLVIRSNGALTLGVEPDGEELQFGFILDGSADLDFKGLRRLGPCDAFVIPPREPFTLKGCSNELVLLRVMSPGPKPR